MRAFIEEALRTLVLSLASVSTAYPSLPVRIGKAAQTDDPRTTPLVVIAPDSEDHENDLTGLGGGVTWTGRIEVACYQFRDVRLLNEYLRSNDTDPGTGLAGFSGTVTVTMSDSSTADFEIDMLTFETSTFSQVFVADGSDDSYYVISTSVNCVFRELK